MIISASRRTDIPAYYSDWLFQRLKAGEVLVRNPMNHHQVSRVELTPDLVDCIVFWTKNPAPMLGRLDGLNGYGYYFTYTLNPYGKPVENSLPTLEKRIQTFRDLSDTIGREKVVWRYDPIILTDTYDMAYHQRQFASIAGSLEGKTDTCVFSFMRPYPKIMKRISGLNYKMPAESEAEEVVGRMMEIAGQHGMVMESCSETVDFSSLGIKPSKCIDDRRISRLLGQRISVDKDKNQREACGCVKSIDIGAYNTCHHDCVYCYANFSKASVRNNALRHDVNAAFMIGGLEHEDKVRDRPMVSYRGPEQLELDL